MKRFTALVLGVLMLISLCASMASCNGSKPKPADELFFSVSDSGIMEKLASSMGFDSEVQNNLMQNNEKNARAAISFGISDFTLGGTPVTQTPINGSFEGIIDRNGSMSGSVNWSYMTDSLKADMALGKDIAALKLDGVTDYLNIKPLFENMGSAAESGKSAELTAIMNDAAKDFENILSGAIDKTKLTEKSEEIEIDGNKVKVRAISYTLTGGEVTAVVEKIVSEAKKSEAITKLFAELGIDGALDDVDFKASENDSISVVRYFEVNEPHGMDAKITCGDYTVAMNSREMSSKDADYADFELNVSGIIDDMQITGSDMSNVKINALYRRENNGSFLCEAGISVGAQALTSSIASVRLSGSTTDTDEGKRTEMTMTVGISGTMLQIPCVITVKKSDKENLDMSFEMSINIPSMLSIKLTAEEKLSLTDEAVSLPQKNEIKDTAPEGAEEKLQEKLKNTIELFETLGTIFGDDTDDDTDYPYDDPDFDV